MSPSPRLQSDNSQFADCIAMETALIRSQTETAILRCLLEGGRECKSLSAALFRGVIVLATTLAKACAG